VIDDAGDDVYLVGISGGAVVCLLTHLTHAPELAGLVLSGGLAHPPRWFALQRALTRLLPEPALVRGMRSALSGGKHEYAQAAATDLRRCGKPTLVDAQRELATLDLRPKLGHVTAPTLVLCGADDRPNVPLSRELAASIPRAELRVVQGANHLWNLQRPDEFNAMLSTVVEA
jgi:pimeloyl-ACP methyl ester carboxylesterase